MSQMTYTGHPYEVTDEQLATARAYGLSFRGSPEYREDLASAATLGLLKFASGESDLGLAQSMAIAVLEEMVNSGTPGIVAATHVTNISPRFWRDLPGDLDSFSEVDAADFLEVHGELAGLREHELLAA